MPDDKIMSVAELKAADEEHLKWVLSQVENEAERRAIKYLMIGIRANRGELEARLRGRLSEIPDYLEDLPTTLKELSLIHQTKAETLRAILEGEGGKPTSMPDMISRKELQEKLWQLDWIQILKEAVESRPTSWGDRPVIEWRNASDCICHSVIHALEREGIIPSIWGKGEGKGG